jgi:phosphate transport system permease protein
MKVETPVGEATAQQPTRKRASRSSRRVRAHRRRRAVLPILGAVLVAIGAAVIAHEAVGVTGPFALTAIAYVAFVIVVALTEFLKALRPDDEIDLTADFAGVDEPHPEVSAVPEPVVLRAVEDDGAPDTPVRRRKVTGVDVSEMAVAMLSAFAFAELVRIALRMHSLVGFAIWWYVAFVSLYFLLARERFDTEKAIDRVVTVLVVSTGMVVSAVLVWMIAFIVIKGWHFFSWHFFTEDLSTTGPLTPGGGAKHAIIGTLEQVGLATIVVVPIGIMTAVYLHEIHGRLAAPIRFIVDAMAGLPSIVAGLLVFTVWSANHGFSGMAGAAALAVLMLPTMTRASEEILRTVPDGLREGALALGAPQWRLVQRVVLPTALAGLLTAALLAIARAIGETAPMLLTTIGSDSTNTNPFKGPQSDLPLFVWKLIREPNKTQLDRAFTGALVLVFLVFILFVSARIITGRSMRKLGRAR